MKAKKRAPEPNLCARCGARPGTSVEGEPNANWDWPGPRHPICSDCWVDLLLRRVRVARLAKAMTHKRPAVRERFEELRPTLHESEERLARIEAAIFKEPEAV